LAPDRQPPADLPSDTNSTYNPQRDAAGLADLTSLALRSRWNITEEDAVTVAPAAGSPSILPVPPASPTYRLVRVIARGGMGEVWQAEQVSLERSVAVKRSLTSEGAWITFRQEAFIAARLEHPNIVPVHDLGEDEHGFPLLAMKLVEGKSWHDTLVEDWHALSPADFLARNIPILASMAQAVAFAHNRGVVHRDLKPSQVMIGEFGEALLMDWGLAIVLDDAPMPESSTFPLPRVPTASSPAGTPALMAPEQTREQATGIGRHTDVFLLGGTLYYLLTGAFPYAGRGPAETFMAAMLGQPIPPTERAPSRFMPPELVAIASKALAFEPTERYPSAREFHHAINDYMGGATKRREASALIASAGQKLEGRLKTYEDLNGVLLLLAQARALWPDHPDEAAMRRDTLGQYVRVALDAGDRTLARAQSGLIDHPVARAALLDQVNMADAEHARAQRQRRIGSLVIVGLLAALAFGGTLFTVSLRRALADATVARDEAEVNSGVALKQVTAIGTLVDTILGSLHDSLDLALPSERRVADLLGTTVEAYYKDRSVVGFSPALLDEYSRQLISVGERLTSLSQPEEGALLANNAIRIREGLELRHDLPQANAYRLKAQSLVEMGQEDESVPFIERSIELRSRLPDADPADIAYDLLVLGQSLDLIGRSDEALKPIQRATAMIERSKGPDAKELINAYLAMSGVQQALGDVSGMTASGQRAYEIAQRHFEPRSKEILPAMSNLANVLSTAARNDEALTYAQLAYDISAEHFGMNHPEMAVPANALGAIYYDRGRIAEAIPMMRQAIDVLAIQYGDDNPLLIHPLINLGVILQAERQLEEALTLTQRALDLAEKNYAPPHPSIALAHNLVGRLMLPLARYEEGLDHLTMSLEMTEAASGPDHYSLIPLLSNQRAALVRLGRGPESLVPIDRALAISDEFYGTSSTMSVSLRVYRAQSLWYTDRRDQVPALVEEFNGPVVRALLDSTTRSALDDMVTSIGLSRP